MKFLTTAMLAATLFTGLAITGCETHTETEHKSGILHDTDTTKTTQTNPITGQTSTSVEKQETAK